MHRSLLLLASSTTLFAALPAQYAEGFDSQASANVTVQPEADTAVMWVDYSNMTIGSTSFSIPEAPRRVPGSAPTRGVLMQVNLTAGLPSAINILAGTTPISFSGRYRLSFDCWQNVTDPVPAVGSTEQLLWGVGTDGNSPIEARHNRTAGTMGIWGWLAGDNDYGTEDAAIFQDGTELADLGDQQPGEGVFFDEAFDVTLTNRAHHCPANMWVRVDIDVDTNGDVRVYYNGIEFFHQAGLSPSGFAMIGFEDPFNSLGSSPDSQWGLFDNFRVSEPLLTACPLPGSAAIQGTATGGEILNGSAIPALGCPMTVRLRGAPASTATLLVMGVPAPTTIPFNLGSCTLGVEVSLPPIANLIYFSDVRGNGQFSIDLPPGAAGGFLCGLSFGFQFFWADNTACGVAHTEGLATTIGF